MGEGRVSSIRVSAQIPHKRFHPKSIRPIGFFQDRCADSVCPEQGSQARQRFVKLVGIAQGGLEKAKLLPRRLDWLGLERDGDDWLLRFKILQMRVQHSEEKIDIIGRLRNFEAALVLFFIRKSNLKSQFFCDQIDCTESQSELLQKTAQHKEERFDCFDFVFELETLDKRFRGLHQLEQSSRFPIGTFPKPDRFGPETRVEVFLIQAGELPEGVNPPFVQDRQNICDWALSVGCWAFSAIAFANRPSGSDRSMRSS